MRLIALDCCPKEMHTQCNLIYFECNLTGKSHPVDLLNKPLLLLLLLLQCTQGQIFCTEEPQ